MEEIKKWFKENQSDVMTGVAISATVGIVAGAIAQAEKISIAKAEAKKEAEGKKFFGKLWCYTKNLAKPIAPIVLTAGVSIAADVALDRICHKQKSKIAALTGALAISTAKTKELMEYKSKADKLLGEKKAQEIKHEINQEKANNDKVPEKIEREARSMPEAGLKQLFKDSLSGQFIYCTVDDVHEAARSIERKILSDSYGEFIPANDFLYLLGAEDYNTEVGKLCGFNQKWNQGGIGLVLDDIIKTPSGMMATVIEYNYITREEAMVLEGR